MRYCAGPTACGVKAPVESKQPSVTTTDLGVGLGAAGISTTVVDVVSCSTLVDGSYVYAYENGGSVPGQVHWSGVNEIVDPVASNVPDAISALAIVDDVRFDDRNVYAPDSVSDSPSPDVPLASTYSQVPESPADDPPPHPAHNAKSNAARHMPASVRRGASAVNRDHSFRRAA